jgi:hypothetical protein
MRGDDQQLYKKAKGREAKRCYLGHVLMENRHGLVVDTRLTQATGTAEREAALAMAEAIPGQHRVTLGGDRNYDTQAFVSDLYELQVTPHVAQHTIGRISAIDGRTTRHPGYATSQRKRKQVVALENGRRSSPPIKGMIRKTSARNCANAAFERRSRNESGEPRNRAAAPSRSTCRVSKPSGPLPGFRRSTAVWSSVGSVLPPALRRFLPWPRSTSGFTG